MRSLTIGTTEGFEVLQNEEGWRIACHEYHPSVNSLEALMNWGMHYNSEESFVLIRGKAVLATAGTEERNEEPVCENLSVGEIYTVSEGEKHAIVLAPKSTVLIIENRDMDRSAQVPMSEEDLQNIRGFCVKCLAV